MSFFMSKHVGQSDVILIKIKLCSE